MSPTQARQVIESLRNGVPPTIGVADVTVGRDSEIDGVMARLDVPQPGALFVQAESGSGKTHWLRFIREKALREGYLVGLVTLDSSAEIRFNRLDQILGAVLRCLEVPGFADTFGVSTLFDLVARKISDDRLHYRSEGFWAQLSNRWQWDRSGVLESPAFFMALRAWVTGGSEVRRFIEGWLGYPWNYYTQRKGLYQRLVAELQAHFIDSRPLWTFFDPTVGLFNFQIDGFAQTWAVFRDIRTLARGCGFRDFVLLFDKVEDILYELGNLRFQKIALRNLFQFSSGDRFTGMSFFAVPPDFAGKFQDLLRERHSWSAEFEVLGDLPFFAVTPLDTDLLKELAMKIVRIHQIAYGWEDERTGIETEIDLVAEEMAQVWSEDRTRQTIRGVISHLDRFLEDSR